MYQYSATAEGSYVAAPAYIRSGTPNGPLPSRAFDNRPNTFTFNTLNLQGSKSSAGVIGWKIELNIGNDANGLSSYNSWQTAPTAGQVATTPAASLCRSAPGGGAKTIGPTMGSAIPFPPFNNPITCNTGVYAHTGGYDATQAYVQYATPNGAWTLTGGKFFTLVGYEVAESWNNAQFGRGLLWNFAEPITHTGVRLAYGGFSHVTLTLGGNNGWDDEVGTGGGMSSLESQAAYTNGNITGSATFLYGPEPATLIGANTYLSQSCNVAANGQVTVSTATCGLNAAGGAGGTALVPIVGPISNRSLVDLIGSYKVTPATIVAANYDMGSQASIAPTLAATGGAIWDGVAGYAGYTSPKGAWGLSGRYEVFNDPQGYRFGFIGSNIRDHEFTVTGIYNFSPNVALKGEYRTDYFMFPGSMSAGAAALGPVVPSGPAGTGRLNLGTMDADLVVHY